MNNFEIIERQVNKLWQGDGGNLNEISQMNQGVLEEIQKVIPVLDAQDVNVLMQYVRDAINHLNIAIERKDDYEVADCLYYEWKEILTVVQELKEEKRV